MLLPLSYAVLYWGGGPDLADLLFPAYSGSYRVTWPASSAVPGSLGDQIYRGLPPLSWLGHCQARRGVGV